MLQTFQKTRKRTTTFLSLMLVAVLISAFAFVAPANAATCTWTYHVRPTDTLGLLAHDYGTTVNELLSLNPQITDMNLILWGSNICLSDTLTPPPPFPNSYTVVIGDTLSAIALHFAASILDLVKANGIGNPDLIFTGETFNVPNNP